MALHKNLTGTDLHEPKGAAAASVGQVYVADGAGSGAWASKNGDILNANKFRCGLSLNLRVDGRSAQEMSRLIVS